MYGTIENCYFGGKVEGNEYKGGIVGYIAGTSDITNSYYYASSSDAIYGGYDVEPTLTNVSSTDDLITTYDEFITWIEQK